ncbi:MAG: LPO_1073/Vpar_1526 family protein [Actinomycetes bacterium]
MNKDRQNLEGGDDSTNVQAGRDVVIHTATPEQVRETVLALFHENFLELRDMARDIATARAEAITTRFLDGLKEEHPEALERFSDPDLQRSVYRAQEEFACSGDEELAEVLVRLLVDRAGEEDRSVRTIALNEAIKAASLLTAAQRRVIGAVFFLRYTRQKAPDLQTFKALLHRSLAPLALGLPTQASDYQHIEYVGAGSVGIGSLGFGAAVRAGNEGFFTRGFAPHQVPTDLPDNLRSQLFVPCFREPDNLQVVVMSPEDVDELLARLAREEDGDALKSLFNIGQLTDAEIESELISENSQLAQLRDAWMTEGGPGHLSLTSVGIAIGHTYWRRLTGQQAPLSIWL